MVIKIEKYYNNLVLSPFRNDELIRNFVVPLEDARILKGKVVFKPYLYWKIKKFLINNNIEFESKVNEDFTLGIKTELKTELRDYQSKIFEEVVKNDFDSMIVLPTGAGKTIIALAIINHLKVKTLIIVPTIDLLKQWKSKIEEFLNLRKEDIGEYYMERKDLKDITITTYASVTTVHFVRQALDKFGLIIFDEVHHLASDRYIGIPKNFIAKFKIGLSATIDQKLIEDIGKEWFFKNVIQGTSLSELETKGHISSIEYIVRKVELTQTEKLVYGRVLKEIKMDFNGYRNKKRRKLIPPPSVMEALNVLRKISFLPTNKIRELEKIFLKHEESRIIVFTRHKNSALEIAKIFGLPLITSDIHPTEREIVLKAFRDGRVRILVSAEALDEGIDLPNIDVVIIVSGRTSNRQLVQRIGRALHTRKEKAIIYELVTKGTIDYKYYRKRHNTLI